MKNLVFVIIILFGTILSGYSQNVNITGSITDEITHEQVANVNISIDGTEYGTSSDSTGYFTLTFPRLPAIVTISHIHYKTKTIPVRHKHDLRRIILTPNIYQLGEAIVKPVINITQGMLLDIIDYEFTGDSILICGYCYRYPKEKNPWLLLISPEGDTIKKQIVGIPGSFYTDCMENIHFVTKTTAYQIGHGKDSLFFEFSEPRQKLEEILYPCMFETEKELIFQNYTLHNQIINYIAINKDSKEYRKIITVNDPVALNMLYYRGLFNSMGNNEPTSADIRFEEMCFYDSIYSPVIKLRDSIFFFNLINDEIIVFDQDFNKCRKSPCEIHHNKDFKEKIITDLSEDRAYGLFERNGLTYVREINLNNGKQMDSYKIPSFKWIDKIRINGNKLYFLYREKYTGDFISLYKMKLQES
jgi:hypothetical protein